MTREKAEKIVKGITDKIECNTVDIDEWAEFWGFTREEYEEFLDNAIKASEQLKSESDEIKRVLCLNAVESGMCKNNECDECTWHTSK